MKRLFFFKSSSNNGSSSNGGSPPSSEKQVNSERGSPREVFPKTRRHVPDSPSSSSGSFLRRSRSFSSAAFLIDGSMSPCNNGGASDEKRDNLGRSRSKQERLGSFEAHHGSSCGSSYCSSNAFTKVIDRHIDGEERIESSRLKNCSQGGNDCRRFPPKFQYADPVSPPDKPKPQSFREGKSVHLHFSSKDCVEAGFGHDSPRWIAKNVIERLSKTHALKEFDHDIPITLEDVYGGSLNGCCNSDLDSISQKGRAFDRPYGWRGLQKQDSPFAEDLDSIVLDDVDMELLRKSKEAEERAMLLAEQLEEESFLSDCGINIPSLIQTIRHLTKEKLMLAQEVSGLLQSRISDRNSAKANLELMTKKLEKENNELQLGLEKELDRRSSDWSVKLEKYQNEEHRLRERVRELAEHNVSLQRKVAFYDKKEAENRSMVAYTEQQLKELSRREEELCDENRDLRENLSEAQEKYRAQSEDLCSVRRNFEEKDNECRELQKSITRLLRTCNEQEKTIVGLREAYGEEFGKKQSNTQVKKLQMEQMRLTGVELSLRRELEFCRVEVDSLRQENISLLDRLKGNGSDVGALTFKLDKEMRSRISCLQNQGLFMLNESNHLCTKLLEFIKGKGSQQPETQLGLDGQFIVECDMKVQRFRRGTENLTRSLQAMATLLREKSYLLESQDPVMSAHPHDKEIIHGELKAEILLTSLLREKLYSKELEVEQMQAELATAVRGNDVLRCEVQNAMDNISCLTHRLKDLELRFMKKDDNITRLQNDLQECSKELSIVKGILPKVSEERDLMWEEVKQYNEKNMLLHSEVILLKKKIETLDEDNLLKEGQITILKDTLGNKTFDLLASPDHLHDFLQK